VSNVNVCVSHNVCVCLSEPGLATRFLHDILHVTML